MVQLVVRVAAAPGAGAALVVAFRRAVRDARLDAACLDARLAGDLTDTDVLWYVEEWASTQAFESNLRSARFTALLSLVELSARPPLLQCRELGEARGLEYFAAVRGLGP